MPPNRSTLVELPVARARKHTPRYISTSPILAAPPHGVRRIDDSSKAPFNSLGLLVDGQTGTATTAFLVAPDTIMTAGHCLFRPELGDRTRNFYFALQYSRTQGGVWSRVRAAASLWGWTEERDHRYDLAIARLDKVYDSPLLALPLLGYQPKPDCCVVGYVSGGAQLWQAQCHDLHWNTRGARVSASMSEGCSGGPWLQRRGRGYVSIGLTSQGNDDVLVSPAWGRGVQELLTWAH